MNFGNKLVDAFQEMQERMNKLVQSAISDSLTSLQVVMWPTAVCTTFTYLVNTSPNNPDSPTIYNIEVIFFEISKAQTKLD